MFDILRHWICALEQIKVIIIMYIREHLGTIGEEGGVSRKWILDGGIVWGEGEE